MEFDDFFDDVFDGSGVEIIASFVVIGWGGDDNEIWVFKGLLPVEGCSEIKFAIREEILDFFVFDRGFFGVDQLDFFGDDVKKSDVMILGEQSGEAKPDVTCTGDGDVHNKIPMLSYIYYSTEIWFGVGLADLTFKSGRGKIIYKKR